MGSDSSFRLKCGQFSLNYSMLSSIAGSTAPNVLCCTHTLVTAFNCQNTVNNIHIHSNIFCTLIIHACSGIILSSHLNHQKMELEPGSYLTLVNGFDLSGSWQKIWFDSSRQQMLLFDGLSYWLWAPWVTVGWDKPVFYYKNKKLPTQVSYARVSLDSHLIAIQLNGACIYVVDISSDRQWQIDIKSTSDNEILDQGMIWSEHGGNSQDLIILTARGIELWKVSPARGQCRLSRFIAAKVKCFWYEPNFRTLLIANYSQSSRLNMHKQTIDLSGYILNFDMSDGPKLELPPPDKIPVFSLGPGIKPEHIYLTSLYGKLYCAAYASSEMSSVVNLFILSKQSVRLKFSLHANLSGPVTFSCFDNLLCCHYFDFNASVFYDILDLKQVETSSKLPVTIKGDLNVTLGDPYCPASPIAYMDCTQPPTQNSFENAGLNKQKKTNRNTVAAFPAASVWDALGAETIIDAEAASSSSDIIGLFGSTPSEQYQQNVSGEAVAMKLKKNSDLQFLANGPLVYDRTTATVWKLKCELGTIAQTLSPHWRSMEFLARRGQAPSAPKPICGPDNDVGTEAKAVLLRHIKNSLLSRIDFDGLRMLLQPMVKAYTDEYIALTKNHEMRDTHYHESGREISRTQANTKNQSDYKGKSWMGPFDQKNNRDHSRVHHAVDERKIRYSVAGHDSSRRFFEPLDVPISAHLLRTEICNALPTLRDRSLSKDVYSTSAMDKSSSRKPDLLEPMNARRGASGLIIVSQVEMLCHVWIPLLELWDKNDLVYFSRALSIYTAEIQATSHIVLVEAALSLLHFKILAALENYLEAARLMQIQFFSDSVELAVEAFDFANELDSASTDGRFNASNASNVLRQSAFDMLWRLGEITTAVRRLLDFGLLSDAISLCAKSKGTWKHGLSPASIPGIDFYNSGLICLRSMEALKTRMHIVEERSLRAIESRKQEILSSLFSFLIDWDNGLFLRHDEVFTFLV